MKTSARKGTGIAIGAALLAIASGLVLQRGTPSSRVPLARSVRVGGAPPPPVQNVLLLMFDDLGARELRLYGGPYAMPNLEALAAGGLTFDAAYGAPSCEAARRMLQTGHSWTSENGDPLASSPGPFTIPLDVATLADRLPLHAACIGGKLHLGSHPSSGPFAETMLAHGWDALVACQPANVLAGGTGYGNDPTRQGGQPGTTWLRIEGTSLLGASAGPEGAYEPDILEAAVVSAWQGAPLRRLFLVNLQLVHEPGHSAEGSNPLLSPALKFQTMLTLLDQQLGRLAALPLNLERTLVVVMGDNGTLPSAALEPTRSKGTTFEGGIRIPLVMFGGPLSPALRGTRTAELVSLVDVHETAVAWGQGSPQSGQHGRSLVPLLAGGAYTSREYVIAGDCWKTPGGDRCIRRADGWKLVQLDADGDDVVDAEHLYQLPDESTDQLAAQPAIAAALRVVLEAEAVP